MTVRVQEAAFDAGEELNAFSNGLSGSGAVVSFSGIVRNEGGNLQRLEIEHYPAMTETAISEFVEQARTKWDLEDCLVIHRYGPLNVGEAIMMVATAAPHRMSAFEAADFLMDYLKSRAPFWKKEVSEAGEHWVASKATDEDALSRWSKD